MAKESTPAIELTLLNDILKRDKKIDKLSLDKIEEQLDDLEELERSLLGLKESAMVAHFKKTKDLNEINDMADYFRRRDDIDCFDSTFFNDLAEEYGEEEDED